MNINIIKLVYLLLGLMLALESFALELFKGDSRVGNTFSDQETAMKILKIGAVGMSGFVSTNSDKFYYVLIGTIVGKVDVQNEAYLEQEIMGSGLDS